MIQSRSQEFESRKRQKKFETSLPMRHLQCTDKCNNAKINQGISVTVKENCELNLRKKRIIFLSPLPLILNFEKGFNVKAASLEVRMLCTNISFSLNHDYYHNHFVLGADHICWYPHTISFSLEEVVFLANNLHWISIMYRYFNLKERTYLAIFHFDISNLNPQRARLMYR